MKKDVDEKSGNRATYMYMREAIIDSLGRPIKPVIGFLFERVPRDTDVIAYSFMPKVNEEKRLKLFIYEDGPIELKLALGEVLTYVIQGVEHTVKRVAAIDGDIGLRVIMDSTTDVFPVVENEFDFVLKSMKFIPDNEKKVEVKLVALDEADIDNEEKTDVPSFVRTKYPNPSSTILIYAFWLPIAANTRIDICTDDGIVVSTVIDKHLQKGAYEVTFNNLSILAAGQYVFKLIVDNEVVETRKQLFLK